MISRFAKSFVAVTLALLVLTTLALLHPPARTYLDPWSGTRFGDGGVERSHPPVRPPPPVPAADADVGPAPPAGGVIMDKLGNATAKAALGRATWKLLHTMTLRYPEAPDADARAALSSYLHLTARLYPCGECAAEFQALLARYPPQTKSRRSAALWLCFVHNQVNARLRKPEFDCAHLDAEYDCGCGDAPVAEAAPGPAAADPMDLEDDGGRDAQTGAGLIKGGR